MVYEWGHLPVSTTDRYSISENDVLAKNDFIEVYYEKFEKPYSAPSESTVAQKIKQEIGAKGQIPCYIYVKRTLRPVIIPVMHWVYEYEINFAFLVKEASPLTGIEIGLAVVAILALLGIALAPYIFPILYKWAGISPEELKEYEKAMPEPPLNIIMFMILIVAIALVLITIIPLFVPKRRRRRK